MVCTTHQYLFVLDLLLVAQTLLLIRHTPWYQEPPQDQTPLPPGPGTPLWTETLTHATENITLPQTSFAGGKYKLAPQTNPGLVTINYRRKQSCAKVMFSQVSVILFRGVG